LARWIFASSLLRRPPSSGLLFAAFFTRPSAGRCLSYAARKQFQRATNQLESAGRKLHRDVRKIDEMPHAEIIVAADQKKRVN
jgi:hypothetical protein